MTEQNFYQQYLVLWNNEKAKLRFGDFCALFDREHAFSYVSDDFDRRKLKLGCHSGNSEDEMKIPLIILD